MNFCFSMRTKFLCSSSKRAGVCSVPHVTSPCSAVYRCLHEVRPCQMKLSDCA